MASPLTPLIDQLTVFLIGSVLPAVLNVLGALLALYVAALGSLMVYGAVTGKPYGWATQKLRDIFDDMKTDAEYEKYKRGREASERRSAFSDRYDREYDFEDRYQRGVAREGVDFVSHK